MIILVTSISKVHCKWNNWVTGECSKTCGTGTRTNTRTKSVTEAYGGTCTGQLTEIEECNTHHCPGRMMYIVAHVLNGEFIAVYGNKNIIPRHLYLI